MTYPCGAENLSKTDLEAREETKSPDFTIKDATYLDEKDGSLGRSGDGPTKNVTLKHSRSFKFSMQSKVTLVRENGSSPLVLSALDLGNSSNTTQGAPSPAPEECKGSERLDSAYGTDSNRTASRNTESSHHTTESSHHVTDISHHNVEKSPAGSYAANNPLNQSGCSLLPADRSGSSLHNRSSSSAAFNNETYMSIDNQSPADQSYMSLSSPAQPSADHNPNNTYQSVHPMSDTSLRSEQNTSQGSQASRVTVVENSYSTPKRPRQDLLKRSPVLRDVTAPFTPIPAPARTDGTENEKGRERLHAPLTIIIPNISNKAVTKASSSSSPDQWSDKTIPLDILNPGSRELSSFSSHDYENMALVNINRAPLDGVQHWRTYSDMATSRHDDSTKYEKSKFNHTSSSDYR